MQEAYHKVCLEKNDCYSVYYGIGEFSSHAPLLHYDSDITITYFKHCRAELKAEGKHYTLHSGDIVIMNPNEIHFCAIDEGSFHERISLYVNKSILNYFPFDCRELFDCFYNRAGGVGNVIPAKTAEKYSLGSTMENILSLSKRKDPKSQILTVCKIIELAAQLNDAAAYQAELSAGNQTVANVIDYIMAHFTENITCTQIAEAFYISKFRLEHLFKECVGVSLWDYVILRRLLFVNEQLQKGLSIKEASVSAGFHNYSNFYRLYKKHMNLCPAEYKQRFQN